MLDFLKNISIRGVLVVLALGFLVFSGVFFFTHAPKAAFTIEMTARGFVLNDITIQQGQTVAFRNVDTLAHWPATSLHPMHTLYPGSDVRFCDSPQGAFMFDACEPIEPGDVWTFTFYYPGQWVFHDHLAPQYSGRVTVKPIDGYRIPLKYRALKWWASIHTIITHPKQTFSDLSSLPGIALIRSGASGLLVGKTLGWDELSSSKDYESEPIFHYTFDDVEIRRVVYQLGIERTMEKILEESDGGGGFECHSGAHLVGRAAYDVYGILALEQCTPACNSGCYHGVMEALFWELGTAEITDEIVDLCSTLPSEFERLQCFHGAGHGLLALSGYDLPATIAECRLLGEEEAVRQCFGGMFMENIRTAVGFSADPEGHSTSWLSLNDPFFPCNFFEGDDDVVRACFSKQSEWMLHLFSQDYEKVGDACGAAPQMMVEPCFKSLGNDIASDVLRDPSSVESLCQVAHTDANFNACIIGASNVVIDFWGSGDVGKTVSFCAAFNDARAREVCFTHFIERIPEIFNTQEAQQTACAALPQALQIRCPAGS